MADFSLTIVTPEGNVFDGQVEYVSAMGIVGSLGILANHAPMICALKAGAVMVRGSETIHYAASEGTLEVRPDKKVVLLLDYAHPCDTAEAAAKKAQELIDIL
ncbi:MAG: F-type H+-transporting ATPase subunit epsilon [Candidatus Omnitrophota bacterium]|jgi:F-type H+-transporting ATPase subunit epsilon